MCELDIAMKERGSKVAWGPRRKGRREMQLLGLGTH